MAGERVSEGKTGERGKKYVVGMERGNLLNLEIEGLGVFYLLSVLNPIIRKRDVVMTAAKHS